MNCYLRCVPLITIALILLSACGSENKKSSINIGHEPFGKGILLDKTIHNSIGDLVIAPSGLYVTDSMTIIIDEYANNNIVSFFDSKTLELITSFGSRGEGPKEFSDSPLILQPDLANKDILELYDWGKKRLVRISLSALLKKDEIEILYETRIPPKVLDAQQVGKINNNLVASGTLSEGLVAFIDDSSFNISYLDFEPFSISKDLNISDRKWFLNMWMAINSDHEKIVLVAERFNHLLIYDFNGELLESIKLDNYEPNYIQNKIDTPYFYTKVVTTNEYIYALWLGKSISQIEEIVGKNESINPEIHVFDWSGNPIRKFLFNTSFISTFTVDKNYKRFIIVNEFSSDSILTFSYSDLIR